MEETQMKFSLVLSIVVATVLTAIAPAMSQFSLPLVETDTKIPAAAGLVFTINAVDCRNGGLAPQTRQEYRKLSEMTDPEFQLKKMMSRDVIASTSSTFGSLAKVIAERPFDYWISVTKVSPAEIEDFVLTFQSDAGRKDHRIGDEKEEEDSRKPIGYSLTLMGNSGYCMALPRLANGIYTPVAWVKLRGSKTYRILGIIPIKTKMSNTFTGGFQFQVMRSPRDLSSCSNQQLMDVLSDQSLGLGWSASSLDPDILDKVLNKRQNSGSLGSPAPSEENSTNTDQNNSVEEEVPQKSQVRITVLDKVKGEWPVVVLKTPDGVKEYNPSDNGDVVIKDATPGEYVLKGVRGTVDFTTDPTNDSNKKELTDGGHIEWTLRRS